MPSAPPCARSRHFRPAGRRRPSPSDAAHCGPWRACSARPRRPWCNCGRGPCGCAPTDRGTSQARNISAGDRRCAWRKSPARPRAFASVARIRGRYSVRCSSDGSSAKGGFRRRQTSHKRPRGVNALGANMACAALSRPGKPADRQAGSGRVRPPCSGPGVWLHTAPRPRPRSDRLAAGRCPA